jgi:regulator of protease activity HflC (stomatin/prohibitin superfamily)
MFGVCILPANHVGVVSTFGRIDYMIEPGLNGYIPLVQRVTLVNNATRDESVEVRLFTSDHASVSLGVMIQWMVPPAGAGDFLTKLDNPKAQLASYIEKELRTAVSRRTLAELFGQQSVISDEIEVALRDQMRGFGIVIVDTQINAVVPEKSIAAAMSAVVASQRELEATRNRAEAVRISMVAEASADAERKKLQGEGTAAERRAVLHGLEEDVRAMADRTGVPADDLLRYVLALQKIDVLGALSRSPNAKVIVMDAKVPFAAPFVMPGPD